MKINELHNQPVQADTYEASMALNQLLKIGKHAIKLHNLINDDAEMEAWVAKKIDLAGDYVKSVHGYMQGENNNLYDDGGLTEDAPFGSGFDLLRMAIMKKFISVQEWDLLKDKWKGAATEIEQRYDDWPEGEGFGSSDHNYAIKELMELVGYEFDDKDTSGRFVVTKQPVEVEKAGIKNARMKDAMPTEDGSSHTSMNKYGLSAREHKGKFYSYKHGKLTGAFDSMKELAKHQEELIKDESVSEDAGEKIANMAQNMTKDEFMSHADELGLTPEEAAEYYEKMQGGAHAGKFEDAGEGHMSKSTLYTTAKYAIELASMIKKGDDLEGWVQSKLNKAADYLIGAYNYEEYQKLNPYREDLDHDTFAKHSKIVQKNIDEILAKETDINDIDTKPGMMRILSKRVNEVEKKMARVAKKYKKNKTEDENLDEGIKEWGKRLAMAGVIVAGLAGINSVQDAIDRSVPAVAAIEKALEMAQDQGNDELAKMIEKDLSAVKVRLSSGKDLNFVKGMQDKYSKFIQTEGLAYESKLAIMLNKSLK